MQYRSLLVHVETDSTSSDARLELAAVLAKRWNATLIGIAAEAPQAVGIGDPYGGGYIGAEIVEAERQQVMNDIDRAKDLFSSHRACKDVLTEWRSTFDEPVEALVREARAADLIVIGRDLERLRLGPARSANPGDVLMRAGRPLLIVPPGTDNLEAKRILIAWKDTREARRALWDALPFLKQAESAHVVEVTERGDFDSAVTRSADVVAHLARHEVNARAEIRTLREGSVADELILVCEQHDADLIVAGGYGHARLREWIFGGVTRDLLKHSPKCCLLSH